MLKKIFYFKYIILLIFGVHSLSYSSHVPPNHPDRSTSFALQHETRIFTKLTPDIKLLFEDQIKASLSDSKTTNHSTGNQRSPEILAYRLGALFRLHKNFKIGSFYQLYNVRHHHSGEFNSEHVFLVDLIPRFKLSRSIVGELRVRNDMNYYTGSDQSRADPLWYSLKLRPKISYFHIRDAQLKWSIYLAYEIYLPVNYKFSNMENWVYLGYLYPITPSFALNPYYSLIIHTGTSDHTGGVTHLFGLSFNINL